MKIFIVQFIILCFTTYSFSQDGDIQVKRIISVVDSSHADNMVLKQTFHVNVPIDSVWNAYTTAKGWENWATAIAEIDLKVNGTIKTNYNKAGTIDDENSITLNIINFVPKQALTLQAELNKHFPQVMKEDEKNLFNLILFEELSPIKTKVISYGIGYKHNDKYISLLDFFIKGNEQSYYNLISYLETGKPSVNY